MSALIGSERIAREMWHRGQAVCELWYRAVIENPSGSGRGNLTSQSVFTVAFLMILKQHIRIDKNLLSQE